MLIITSILVLVAGKSCIVTFSSRCAQVGRPQHDMSSWLEERSNVVVLDGIFLVSVLIRQNYNISILQSLTCCK